jgi:excisionase family DNA binding protein
MTLFDDHYGAMTVDEFINRFRISRSRLYEMMNSGEIVAHKAGGRTLFLRSEIDRWMKSLPVRPRPSANEATAF